MTNIQNDIAYNPMRKISNRGSRKVIGFFFSIKTKRYVQWEERLEKDFVYLPEFDKSVIRFYSQPLQVKFRHKFKKRTYTADFILVKVDCRIVVEVKPEQNLSEYEELFPIVKTILNKEGYEFLVLTERFIRQQPRLNNIKRLNRYKSVRIRQCSLETVIKYFEKRSRVAPFHESKKDLIEAGVTVNEFFALIFHQYLVININDKITWYSLIALNQNLI